MSAPAPGSTPMMMPMTLPRHIGHWYFLVSAHCPLRMLPKRRCGTFGAGGRVKARITSDEREHADQRRHRLDPAEQVRHAEGEARRPRRVLHADAGHQQAEQHRRDGLHRRGARHQGRAHQPEQGQPEILVGGEGERHLGEQRRHQHQRQGADDAADGAEPQPGAERDLRLALARHRVGLVRVGGGGRRAGDAQQAARYVAREDRHGGSGDDGRHRRDGREVEGDGHQQRRRHGGGKAGQGAHHQPVDGGGGDRHQHVRRRDHAQRFEQRAHAAAQGAGRMPAGKGTRRSL